MSRRSCFFQKNVFILVVFTNIKQSFLLFFFCSLRRDALPFALSALSLLHFEEAFVVVVVSEGGAFCLGVSFSGRLVYAMSEEERRKSSSDGEGEEVRNHHHHQRGKRVS